ncbi:glycosyltransferase [Microbacterium sp. zg-YB36]|uniref:glycosyltransferase n=1 Tax=Microbacterium sp. zg-YB36 TaxID=2969407 RepID=UPI00214BCBD3|nr:glycosyltransferase [Microbacterium sp. zg-YB36]MDL5352584.1 glycosyltransferase [Microbacterium sp. zg-YB36]
MAVDRLLQRVVFPQQNAPAPLPLYVATDDLSHLLPWSRTTFSVAARSRQSFAAYFSAFPAAWWRESTVVDRVRLQLNVSGTARVSVVASDRSGASAVVAEREIHGQASFDIDLPEDVGWVWFDVTAGATGVVVEDAAWHAVVDAPRPVSAAVCITTINRHDDCLALLDALAEDPVVWGRLGRVIVVDQGSLPLREAPGFAEVRSALGDRLIVVEQRNLGGSGGFSRGMLTAVGSGATHALLLDDDVRLESDSVVRACAFSAYAREEVVVGGQMLNLREPSRLHTMGELVDRTAFWWRPVDPDLADVDLERLPLADSAALHAPRRVDFNGWWFCMIPLPLVQRAGAAMPMFIKWDDAEFGLRAAAAGVDTVTVPGIALWHMPWTGKDDGLDWQAYFQLRNRLITALLHSTNRRPGRLLAGTLAQDVNHVLCLQYGSSALRIKAMRDALRGPEYLRDPANFLPADGIAILTAEHQIPVEEALLPGVDDSRPAHVGPPRGPVGSLARLVRVAAHQVRRPRSQDEVQMILDRRDGRWWRVGLLDAVAVRSATGEGAFVGRRDRQHAVSLLLGSVVAHARLWWAWPRLAARYRAAAADLASLRTWETAFSVDPGESSSGR